MNPLFSHKTLKVALILGAPLLLPSSGFAQGNAPKALSVTDVFGPRTEMAMYMDLAGAQKSGFIKKVEAEFPELMEAFEEAEEEMSEFTTLTGLALEDIAEVAMSFTGMDAIFAAMEQGEEPDFGPDGGFVFAGRIAKPMDVEKLIGIIMAKAEEEDGPETRKMIEDARSEFQGATIFELPKEFMEENDVPFPMSAGIRSVGKSGFLAIGKTADVKHFFSGGKSKKAQGKPFSSEVTKALPKGSQIWLSLPVPEAVLDQATEELSENPILAGLAQVMGKIRELGVGIHFKDESMSLSLALACEDAQSAVQMWTLSQGLLAMAKLAASSEEAEIPPFIQKITSVAKEKAVVFSTEVTVDDLSGLAENIGGGFEPEGIEDAGDDPEALIGDPAPDFKVALLDGNDFKLSAAQGKKVVVLDFWATWCGPCVKAMPEVRAATDALKDKGVILVAVNQGERPGVIQKFLKKSKWDGLTVGLDPEGEIADKYGVEGIPQTVIIDKEGVIREVHVGYGPGLEKRLLSELKEILSE